MRGGRISRRDRWFGFEEKADFSRFRHWWHRVGKDEAGGNDISDREEAERVYDDWVSRGRPTVR
jgi:hypothetical protein